MALALRTSTATALAHFQARMGYSREIIIGLVEQVPMHRTDFGTSIQTRAQWVLPPPQ